ncbi:MAG: hypothetical protein ACM3SY_22530 [Candidatus Omnitrophota bacterium]
MYITSTINTADDGEAFTQKMRTDLGIAPGDTVAFDFSDDQVVIRKGRENEGNQDRDSVFVETHE